MYQIRVFISHSWKYSEHYDKLSEWISESWEVGRLSLKFIDTSVPKDNPIHNAPNDTALRDAIFKKIEQSHVILIMTGMYVHYSKWIQKEIDGAKKRKESVRLLRVPATITSDVPLITAWAAKCTACWDEPH